MQTLFRLKTRMIDVKDNFGSSNTNNKSCFLFRETQQHLLQFPEIKLRTKNYNIMVVQIT